MTSFAQNEIGRRTLLGTAALAGAAGLAGLGGTAAAAPVPEERALAAAGSSAPRTIRLTTGDRVRLRGTRIVDVEPADRLVRTPYVRYRRGGDEHVVPVTELARIRSGETDERLFNVTGLARAGYADARHAQPTRIAPARPAKSATEAAAGTFQVTAKVWDRLGKNPVYDQGYNVVYFIDAGTGDLVADQPGNGAPAPIPAGRYLAVAPILTMEPDADFPSRTLMAWPGFQVTADTEIEFDARTAERVAVTLPDADAETTMGIVSAATLLPDIRGGFVDLSFGLDRFSDVYTGSPAGASDPNFVFIHRHMLQLPELQVTAKGQAQQAVKAEWYVPGPRLLGSRSLTGISVGAATAEELTGLDLEGKVALLNLPAQDEAEFVTRLRALADAGAVAALHVGPDTPSPGEDQVPLPTGYAIGAGAAQLAELEVGSTIELGWRGVEASPYRYDLSFPARHAIPAKQDHQLARADLAQLRVTYASQGAPAQGFTGAAAFFFGISLGAGGGAPVHRPTVRDEYVTPGEWELNSVGWAGGDQAWQVTRTYQAGHHYVIDWHKAVLGPAFPEGSDSEYYKVARDGDTIWSQLLMFTDGQRNPGELWYPTDAGDFTVTGSQAIYRNGTLLARVDDNTIATFVLPAAKARYELRARTTRRSAWWQRATDIQVAWTFETARTYAPTMLPILTIHAAADVDETSSRPADRSFLLPIRVFRQDTGGFAPVRTLEVDYSLQDGKTWQPAPVVTSGVAEWTARIGKPGKGLLSLRFNVADRDGNTVTQTVIRAVQLK